VHVYEANIPESRGGHSVLTFGSVGFSSNSGSKK
jgi:hypothetical protein